MDKELKQMLDNSKIDKIYSNSLFSLKSISEDLGIWEGFSNTEKMYLENITKSSVSIDPLLLISPFLKPVFPASSNAV